MATTMAIDQLKNLIGAIRMDPARAPDGKYDQVSDDKTSVVADMYNLGFNEKKTLVEVRYGSSTTMTSWNCDGRDGRDELLVTALVSV